MLGMRCIVPDRACPAVAARDDAPAGCRAVESAGCVLDGLTRPAGSVRNGVCPVASVVALRTGVAATVLAWKAGLMT